MTYKELLYLLIFLSVKLFMMSKFLILSTIIYTLLLIGCTSQNQVIIEGTIEGLQAGDRIIMKIDDFNDNTISRDTAVTNGDKFRIQREFSDMPFVTLFYEPSDSSRITPFSEMGRMVFIPAPTKITIKGKISDFNFADISGGVYENTNIKEYTNQSDNLSKAYFIAVDSLRQAYRRRDNATAEKHHGIYMEKGRERDELKKSFIKEHPDLEYAAYLYYFNSLYEPTIHVKEQYSTS